MQYRKYSTLFRMTRSKLTTFAERIEFVLEQEGVSQAELGRLIGVERATVREWISGRSKSPRPEVVFRIEDKLGYSARWLATGEEPIKARKIDPADTTILDAFVRLPANAKSSVKRYIEFELKESGTP